MTEPSIIEPVMQKDVWDCGIACLQMITGMPYAEVRQHVRAKAPTGLSNAQVKRIAAKVGKPLAYRKELRDDDIGILDLQRSSPSGPEGHFAIYVNGSVFNPADGLWYTDIEAYLTKSRYDVVGVFVRKGQE